MKTNYLSFLILATALFITACGQQKSNDNETNDPTKDTANQALYDEVMKIHDEVMPKMQDLRDMKKKLQEEIAKTPEMVEEKKKEIEAAISKLDSASKGMMDWMHEFSPPDSVTKEEYKQYLEDQLIKVKKVKDDILEALKGEEKKD